MSLFLVQHRRLKLRRGRPPVNFPASMTAEITFGPEDAFGVASTFRTTAAQAKPARINWNANEGVTWLKAGLIERVDTAGSFGNLKTRFSGNVLTLNCEVESINEAAVLAASATQLLPGILSFRLRVFVWIKNFAVEVGSASFGFEVSEFRFRSVSTTADANESALRRAIGDWCGTSDGHRRMVSALYYFRHALRLASLQPDGQSLVSEVMLNLCKSLEVLFSANRECVRERARAWGLSGRDVENRIIPLMLLRNELDMAHVATAPLEPKDRQTIIDFSNTTLAHVRRILEHVFDGVQTGRIKLDPVSPEVDTRKRTLLHRIREYMGHSAVEG